MIIKLTQGMFDGILHLDRTIPNIVSEKYNVLISNKVKTGLTLWKPDIEDRVMFQLKNGTEAQFNFLLTTTRGAHIFYPPLDIELISKKINGLYLRMVIT